MRDPPRVDLERGRGAIVAAGRGEQEGQERERSEEGPHRARQCTWLATVAPRVHGCLAMSNLIRLAAILAGLAACGGGPPAVPDAAAELRIEPARVDFGVLVFGAAPVARRIEVTNLAAARALDLTARIEGAGAASFAIAAADCGALDPGRSRHLDVTATAAADGPLEAAVIVASGARRGAAALVGAGRGSTGA